jgi:hypothetical protein
MFHAESQLMRDSPEHNQLFERTTDQFEEISLCDRRSASP